MYRRFSSATLLAVLLAAACGTTDSPAGPSSLVTVAPARAIGITISGPVSYYQRGQTAQLRAMVSLSNGMTEDRTSTVQWQSTNNAVMAVSNTGVVTVGNEGDATIRATMDDQTGSYNVRVRYATRTPDPPAGQNLQLPGNAQQLIQMIAAERPDLINQSCPEGLKYINNPWQDYMLDRLRQFDTRWGYNAKPTRTAADNNGRPVIAAGDEIAYNYSSEPDEGTTKVYLIDILESHCGTPRLTFRHFTGEEPGRWTGAGRF